MIIEHDDSVLPETFRAGTHLPTEQLKNIIHMVPRVGTADPMHRYDKYIVVPDDDSETGYAWEKIAPSGLEVVLCTDPGNTPCTTEIGVLEDTQEVYS